MFIEVLFIIAKRWKQLKWPSSTEWINNHVVYKYNGTLFAHKKEWNCDTQKDKYYDSAYMKCPE